MCYCVYSDTTQVLALNGDYSVQTLPPPDVLARIAAVAAVTAQPTANSGGDSTAASEQSSTDATALQQQQQKSVYTLRFREKATGSVPGNVSFAAQYQLKQRIMSAMSTRMRDTLVGACLSMSY
jgi:hypothetical protein